jgi:hypothetical protein
LFELALSRGGSVFCSEAVEEAVCGVKKEDPPSMPIDAKPIDPANAAGTSQPRAPWRSQEPLATRIRWL